MYSTLICAVPYDMRKQYANMRQLSKHFYGIILYGHLFLGNLHLYYVLIMLFDTKHTYPLPSYDMGKSLEHP